jgi:hypothetical protein
VDDKPFFLLLVALASAIPLPQAMAAESFSPPGDQALMPQGPWAVALSEEQMAELRGGYFGVNLQFLSSADNQQEQATDNNVELATAVPSTDPPNNFSGILQQANVVGNFNVVNNFLFLQLFVVNSDQITTADLANVLSAANNSLLP